MSNMKANPVLAAKLFPKQDNADIDTAAKNTEYNRNVEVLYDAFNAWAALDKFRKDAQRNKRFTFGDQWGDKVTVRDDFGRSKSITERQHIIDQGNQPLVNNRIRGILRSVVGVFQSAQTEPVCVARDRDEQGKGETMSATLQYVYQMNRLWGLDSVNLEYFLITGLACFRSSYGWRNDKVDVWTDIVNYNNIFFDPDMEDPRHWDCHLIGQIHELGLYDVIAQFTAGEPGKVEDIRRIYGGCSDTRLMRYHDTLRENIKENINFFIPDNASRCRVIEIWKKESKARLRVHDKLTGDFFKVEVWEESLIKNENERRIYEQSSAGVAPENMKLIEYQWFVDNYWQFYYMSPYGDILQTGETPYWHGSHPYSFKLYPFIDRQVFPFISDFIDQQKLINRMVMMQDFIMRTSAKGVLLFPEDALPDGYSMEEIAEEWTKYNGLILYKPKQGVPAPQQIINNTVNTGAYDMLQIQLKMLEDISGVQGALQGQAPKANTPASLYLQQTQNATNSLTELFEAYRELREERDLKNLKLIQQYYTEPKYINVIGSNVRNNTILYNPDKVRNAEYELSITESTSTPAYRLVMNDFLMQLFNTQQITINELLENGAFPFADKLLQAINARQQDMVQGSGGALEIPQEVQQLMDSNTSPLVKQMANNNN